MIGKFLLWLQERIKHWVKPATPILVSGVLSDLSRNRIDLVVENALLRQQLIDLKRQVKRPQLTDPDRFASFSFPTSRNSGNNHCILSSQRHSCAGIGNCFVSIGGGSRKASQRFHRKRSSSSTSWPGRIDYGEPNASAVNC